ncbi:hypothetical protein LM895_000160 [Campylobacter jejuni]|nr:hypothetical protein [Campylobacter jejuni]
MSYLIQNIKTTNDLKEKLYTVSKKWLLEHILYKDVKVEQYRRSSLTSEDDGEVSFEEVKEEKDDENTVYLYTCECVEQMHDVPFGIHQKIQLKGVKFKCKKCKEAVGGKIKCRKRKIKCRIFATNYLSFNLKLKL